MVLIEEVENVSSPRSSQSKQRGQQRAGGSPRSTSSNRDDQKRQELETRESKEVQENKEVHGNAEPVPKPAKSPSSGSAKSPKKGAKKKLSRGKNKKPSAGAVAANKVASPQFSSSGSPKTKTEDSFSSKPSPFHLPSSSHSSTSRVQSTSSSTQAISAKSWGVELDNIFTFFCRFHKFDWVIVATKLAKYVQHVASDSCLQVSAISADLCRFHWAALQTAKSKPTHSTTTTNSTTPTPRNSVASPSATAKPSSSPSHLKPSFTTPAAAAPSCPSSSSPEKPLSAEAEEYNALVQKAWATEQASPSRSGSFEQPSQQPYNILRDGVVEDIYSRLRSNLPSIDIDDESSGDDDADFTELSLKDKIFVPFADSPSLQNAFNANVSRSPTARSPAKGTGLEATQTNRAAAPAKTVPASSSQETEKQDFASPQNMPFFNLIRDSLNQDNSVSDQSLDSLRAQIRQAFEDPSGETEMKQFAETLSKASATSAVPSASPTSQASPKPASTNGDPAKAASPTHKPAAGGGAEMSGMSPLQMREANMDPRAAAAAHRVAMRRQRQQQQQQQKV
mmetsp:Transcript_42093/g.82684  ORF Transcript_42093/g.82684 Transcript_42093/m.82684 type:complete len:565 (+) Transcript_42093:98-1792(+)